MSRKEETTVSKALEQLARAFDGEAVKNNITRDMEVYSPWLDVVELWDYTGDTK